MPTYEIIDAHTHTYPDATGGKAFLKRLNFNVPREGSLAEAERSMATSGIKKIMVVPWMQAKQIFEQRVAAAKETGGKADEDKIKADLANEWDQLNSWGPRWTTASTRLWLALIPYYLERIGRRLSSRSISLRVL